MGEITNFQIIKPIATTKKNKHDEIPTYFLNFKRIKFYLRNFKTEVNILTFFLYFYWSKIINE